MQQALVVPRDRLRHRVEQDAASLASFVLAPLGVANRDAGLAREPLDGADEVEMLDLAHERDRVATDAAAEALEQAVLFVDVERAGLLRVERAQPDPSPPDPLELHVLRDDVTKVDGIADTLDVLVHDAHTRDDGSGRALRRRRARTCRRRYFRTSNTRLNGVSVARRKRE